MCAGVHIAAYCSAHPSKQAASPSARRILHCTQGACCALTLNLPPNLHAVCAVLCMFVCLCAMRTETDGGVPAKRRRLRKGGSVCSCIRCCPTRVQEALSAAAGAQGASAAWEGVSLLLHGLGLLYEHQAHAPAACFASHAGVSLQRNSCSHIFTCHPSAQSAVWQTLGSWGHALKRREESVVHTSSGTTTRQAVQYKHCLVGVFFCVCI
jgi:hypothetical protein